MKRHKYATIMSQTLRNSFIYRGNLIGGMAFFIMIIFVFFNLWGAIYGGKTIEGYDLTQTVWYLCLTELIVFGTRSGVFSQMNQDIKSGSIAYLLNRPCHYISYQFFTSIGEMGFKIVSYGVLSIALGMIMVGPLQNFSWVTFPFALMALFMGMIVNFFLQMALGLTAFWWEDNTSAFMIYNKLVFMLGMLLPLEMLPGWLQGIARALPFTYIAWGPARLMVRFDWTVFLQVFPMQLLWAGVGLGLSLWIYRRGVRNIQSQGG